MLYGNEYIDKYVKVIDKKNDTVIASGKVIGSKNDFPNGGISFDMKWFFRETEHLKFEIVNFVETKLLDVEPDKIGLTWGFLKDDGDKLDVRRDFGYDELDEDIKDFVYRLNDLSGTIKTTTSCCGHGQKSWYIEFEFSEFWDMSLFINVVEALANKLRLKNSVHTGNIVKKKNIHLQLESLIIDENYMFLNEFCTLIEKEFKKKKTSSLVKINNKKEEI